MGWLFKKGHTMTEQEVKDWQGWMKSVAGCWTVDPIHHGMEKDNRREDLLMYVIDPEDNSKGIYISVNGKRAMAGKFDKAYDHVANGEFQVMWSHEYDNYGDAVARVLERAGVSALLAVIEPAGVSPYRVM